MRLPLVCDKTSFDVYGVDQLSACPSRFRVIEVNCRIYSQEPVGAGAQTPQLVDYCVAAGYP